MPSFANEHFDLLQLSNIFEPKEQYSFDLTFGSLDQNLDTWDELFDGPTPTAELDCTPRSWYTQYWFECAQAHLCANLDGYDFRDLCDYNFDYDESIYTGHPLDLY